MSNNDGVKSENLSLGTARLLDITLSNDFPRTKVKTEIGHMTEFLLHNKRKWFFQCNTRMEAEF